MVKLKVKDPKKLMVGYADIVGDLFHWGHIEFLERCKSLCDYLVVGIEADERVSQYKRRPIFPYDKRVEMVKALRCVDEVRENISWDAVGTMKQLVSEGYNLKFWFHGDEGNKPWLSASHEYIESIGGEAVITPYIQGVSTTAIIETILKEAGVKN